MIKVCICITTYNLEDYIEEALKSILSQKTSFDFQVIVADDCSTDNTLSILREYAREYPEKITVLCAENNMGYLANSNRLFDGLECEYFSFIDGDDYWVGEDRLQKQVDYLDSHSEYMICTGNTQYLRDGKLSDYLVKRNMLNKSYDFNDMLKDQMPFFHTSSMLVRNTIFIEGIPECFKLTVDTFENCALRGEDFRRIIHLEKGPLYAFDEVFSVYRIHNKGIWQGSSATKRHLEAAISYNFYAKYYRGKYGSYFENKKREAYSALMREIIINRNLLQEYSLSEEENDLLISLLSEFRSDKTLEIRHPFLRRIYFKLIVYGMKILK